MIIRLNCLSGSVQKIFSDIKQICSKIISLSGHCGGVDCLPTLKKAFIVCVQTAVEINNNGRRLSQINTITQSPDQNFTRFFLLIILFAKLHFARNVLCTCSASDVVVTQSKHKHIKSIQK